MTLTFADGVPIFAKTAAVQMRLGPVHEGPRPEGIATHVLDARAGGDPRAAREVDKAEPSAAGVAVKGRKHVAAKLCQHQRRAEVAAVWFRMTAAMWIMVTMSPATEARAQEVRSMTGQSESHGGGVVNWAAPEHGARYHAGPNTQFLGSNDLRSLVASEGDRAIFRHGPRGLEEIIIVELAAPVLVQCVAFGTSIGDVVRVPTGFDVYLSSSGAADSYQFAGACTQVIASRSMVVVQPATSAVGEARIL